MGSSSLTIRQLKKTYGNFIALAPTDLDVPEGEFLTLLGPSGSGKTTLLNLISGLTTPDSGSVLAGERDMTFAPPHARDLGVVFQNYALFPHMTIVENIAFPLQMRKIPNDKAKSMALEALEMVRLPQVAQRYPKELSGGQQQRIALARCMVYKPSIILMDEPLGALDKNLREHMQIEIKQLHREMGTTIVYVTHDQEEAMTMSDRICLMNAGAIEQLGTPADLYFRPQSLFTAQFLGESNIFKAQMKSDHGEECTLQLAGTAINVRAMRNNVDFSNDKSVNIMIRPQNMIISYQPSENSIKASIFDVMVTGSLTKLYVNTQIEGGNQVVASFVTRNQSEQYKPNDIIYLSWDVSDSVVLPNSEERK
ncbi:ABC transporter ATP-binding protein [Bartonella sp. HY406]|uniref:ABC transporter ATP-binding protein n=1 Tax=Bartonella sp. HY406 TaxID=2979331 RepID=UPI0021C7D175|nr:ABC transporter ATP-binding protein [Bartonella sp. HY406]UXN03585.1 ABC transporter ATP-binding protein [Bartonella sp. HY406]